MKSKDILKKTLQVVERYHLVEQENINDKHKHVMDKMVLFYLKMFPQEMH